MDGPLRPWRPSVDRLDHPFVGAHCRALVADSEGIIPRKRLDHEPSYDLRTDRALRLRAREIAEEKGAGEKAGSDPIEAKI